MRIGSILENQNIEKRISLTPEIVKKYTSLGLEVYLSDMEHILELKMSIIFQWVQKFLKMRLKF